MTEIREKANEIATKYNLTEEEEEMIKMWLKDSFLEMVIKDDTIENWIKQNENILPIKLLKKAPIIELSINGKKYQIFFCRNLNYRNVFSMPITSLGNEDLNIEIEIIDKLKELRDIIYKKVYRPEKKQLIDVIKNGNDDINNTLYLKLNGKFSLYFDAEIPFKNSGIDYIGAYETFSAGNGYIGKEATKDKVHINNLFKIFLNSWLDYKEEKKIKQYLGDYYTEYTIEELQLKIDNLIIKNMSGN